MLADAFYIEKCYTDYDELLKDPTIDVVHINTPIKNHAEQSLKALRAFKHVACPVPMATTVEDCRLIVEVVQETGCMYMMIETDEQFYPECHLQVFFTYPFSTINSNGNAVLQVKFSRMGGWRN